VSTDKNHSLLFRLGEARPHALKKRRENDRKIPARRNPLVVSSLLLARNRSPIVLVLELVLVLDFCPVENHAYRVSLDPQDDFASQNRRDV
jgi:hypothetical protein